MQGIFFGLPRSGKTSTKKRLVGKKPALKQTSTGVAEKVSRVELEKSTVQHLSQYTWNEVTELSDETAVVIEEIVDHIAANVQQIGDSAVVNVSTDDINPIQEGGMEHNLATPKDGRIRTIVRKVKAMFKRKPRNVSHDQEEHRGNTQELAPNQENAVTHLRLLSSALQRSSITIFQRGENQWTIYISDAGGQSEFQEMLPALVSGPSLYFLTFPLHKGLNERFVVEYQHPNGKCIVPFEDSCTVKEVLLQSLASIASTRSYIRLEDGKSVTPKVLFIATHRDKLQSEQQLIKIDQELQEIIKKTAAYKENMIEFYSEEQMVFALNNTSDDDTDIQHVRDAVERIGTRGDEYKIQTPYTWMIFAITLRHLHEKVLSIDKCMEIANECGIDTRQELNDALWFLHHNVGIVRHFQEHPDLKDVVIKEPQYIFDKVTELIVDTFTFQGVGPHEHEEFTKKGIFPADSIKTLSSDSDTLTGEKFGDLLEHLHIIAPIEEDGKVVKYFAPAALSHAELPPDTPTKEDIPPMHIVFESGFCPKGMFGALVVSSLKNSKRSQFEWILKEDKIYRDQICLSIGPYLDSFRFSLSPTNIKISLSTTSDRDRKVPLDALCRDVRREVESSIRNVTEALHYTQRAAHHLAFACPEPPPHDQSHAAIIKFSPKGEPCTMICQLSGKLYDLPDGYMVWFNEVDLPKTFSPPKLHQVDLIDGNGKTVKVIEQAAAKWERVATRLYFESHDICRIKKDNPLQSFEACQTVFIEWLNGKGRKPISWETLIKALKEADLSELAADLEVVLSAS